MRPDNGRVDHLDAFADAFGLVQGFKQELPQSGERPAPELSIDRRPFAEMSVQVAPLRSGAGDPENFHPEQADDLLAGGRYARREPSRWLKAGPFLIRHQSPNQAAPPSESDLESEP